MVKFHKTSASLSALWVSTNDKLSDFYASSWQRGDSPVPLLVVRLMLTAFALGILSWSTIDASNPYWLIYLTNWGILLVMATTMSGLVVSSVFLCKKPYETTELPWYVSLYWMLFNIGVTLSLMITALYWILLYNPASKEQSSRAFRLDVATHGLTSCIMMLELLISRTPVRLAHIYQPLGVAFWYSVFSVIYYAAGGTDLNGNRFIYELLDWQNGRRATVVVIGSIAGLIVLYLALWCIAICRDRISRALLRSTSHNLPQTSSHNQVDSQIV